LKNPNNLRKTQRDRGVAFAPPSKLLCLGPY
jgi:hypothetical protein